MIKMEGYWDYQTASESHKAILELIKMFKLPL